VKAPNILLRPALLACVLAAGLGELTVLQHWRLREWLLRHVAPKLRTGK
jgi:hypothetical protein